MKTHSEPRYQVITCKAGVQYLVVDLFTHKSICECFSEDTAKMICDMLNEYIMSKPPF